MRLAEENVKRMKQQLPVLFTKTPKDDPSYAMAELRLEQAYDHIKMANTLISQLFKDYAANGELRENRKELKYAKIRHQ
jgi:hypothetical protein